MVISEGIRAYHVVTMPIVSIDELNWEVNYVLGGTCKKQMVTDTNREPRVKEGDEGCSMEEGSVVEIENDNRGAKDQGRVEHDYTMEGREKLWI